MEFCCFGQCSVLAPNGKNYEYAVLGAYKDSVLKILHSGFYCSDTNIWNTDHGLVGLVDRSKSYIYTEDFWKPQTAAVKSKWDPEHWNFKAVPGSQIAFRINTSRPASNSFDYSTMLEVDVDQTLSDISSISKEIGWKPTIKLEDWLKTIITTEEIDEV